MQRLDYDEFLGCLAPGGALLFGVSRVYPEVGTALAASSLTIGDLGIFVILSYATGHAVQAIGNVIETARASNGRAKRGAFSLRVSTA